MTAWLGIALDIFLIAVVSAGVVQAIRLIRELRGLRASRADMDRFVRDFNMAVLRADEGIKTLRAIARESGDDLEKLVEKAIMVRDELTFIVESADHVAERLSGTATKAMRMEQPKAPVEPPSAEVKPAPKKPAAVVEQRAARKPAVASVQSPAAHEKEPLSRAEQELIQALKKLG